MNRYRNALALLRGQLWPVPGLFALGAVALAYLLISYGASIAPSAGTGLWWLYSGEANTARNLLSSLLSGLMTMTSLVVSVTFVILTLAANQLGPRLISIFMGDRQIQSVLGLFIGTILYIVLVLRTIDDTLGSDGVPHLAITVASALTILCVMALLFYIHKVANSIIADNVIDTVAREFRRNLQSMLHDGEEGEAVDDDVPFSGGFSCVSLQRDGYLQVVDYKQLVAIACKADVRIEVKVRAGQYVLTQGDHAAVFSTTPPAEELQEKIRSAFTIGAGRTPAQDPEHGIRQLVEIAARALSPGINDLYSAIAVIDRLGSVFADLFSSHLQRCRFADERSEVRVIADRTDMPSLVETALQPIRHAAVTNPLVLSEIASMIAKLSSAICTAEQRLVLLVQLERLEEAVSLASFTPYDKAQVLKTIDHARERLAVRST